VELDSGGQADAGADLTHERGGLEGAQSRLDRGLAGGDELVELLLFEDVEIGERPGGGGRVAGVDDPWRNVSSLPSAQNGSHRRRATTTSPSEPAGV
jgi:hypothetical protein